MTKTKQIGRDDRLDMIAALELADGFRLHYEGGAGDRHRVRMSRNLPGATFEGTLEDVLTEFRWHRRQFEDGGVVQMASWLVDARSTYDALTGGDDDE